MILPKFTLRQSLGWVIVAGVLSIVLAAASQGKEWAISQTAVLIAALAVALLAAFAYWIFFLFGCFLTRRAVRRLAAAAHAETSSDEAKL